MASMLTTAAFSVRQLRTTDGPRSTARGSAVMDADGEAAGAVLVGPRLFGSMPLLFLWQPVTALRASTAAVIAKTFRSVIRVGLIIFSCIWGSSVKSFIRRLILGRSLPQISYKQRKVLFPTPVWHV